MNISSAHFGIGSAEDSFEIVLVELKGHSATTEKKYGLYLSDKRGEFHAAVLIHKDFAGNKSWIFKYKGYSISL